jgi:hypothetical protein
MAIYYCSVSTSFRFISSGSEILILHGRGSFCLHYTLYGASGDGESDGDEEGGKGVRMCIVYITHGKR